MIEEFNQHTAIVALGANLENPLEKIKSALNILAKPKALTLLKVSSLYLTEPQGGPPGQNWYHNAVAIFNSTLTPQQLLTTLLETENILGRKRLEKWGPRIIDLDFIAQGNLIIDDGARLQLPHPMMEERLFVMAPLAEIAPKWHHPVSGKTAFSTTQRLKELNHQGIKKLEIKLDEVSSK